MVGRNKIIVLRVPKQGWDERSGAVFLGTHLFDVKPGTHSAYCKVKAPSATHFAFFSTLFRNTLIAPLMNIFGILN